MKRLVLLDTVYTYPLEQAKTTVLNLASQLLTKKDGIKRTIGSVLKVPSLYAISGKTSIKTDFAISKPKTPCLYIANFKDNNGYIILSADKRAVEVLATVGTGTMDSSAHPGLRLYLSKAITYIDEKVGKMEALRGDSIFESAVKKINDAHASKIKSNPNGRTTDDCINKIYIPGANGRTACSSCQVYESVVPIQTVDRTNFVAQPILGTMLWHQGPPYNNWQTNAGCNTSSVCGSNRNYLAGCVAIAESQVVAHFKAFNSLTWQSIVGKDCSQYSPTEADLTARLAMDIFDDYGIYTSSRCGSTGAGLWLGGFYYQSPKGISPKYGLVQGEWRDYNVTDLRNSLSQGSPVVTSGFDNLKCFLGWWPCWGAGNAHEWVIDGMRDLGVQTTYQYTSWYSGPDCGDSQLSQTYSYTFNSSSTTSTQVHQNWGWGTGTGSGPNDW
jgi:hypothetical protein